MSFDTIGRLAVLAAVILGPHWLADQLRASSPDLATEPVALPIPNK